MQLVFGEVREWLNRTVSKTVVPPGTVGSNPTLSVIESPEYGVLSGPHETTQPRLGAGYSGAVAQLGERQNRTLEASGSIPLCSI